VGRNGTAVALTNTTAWTGGAVPGTGDVATWNSSSTSFASENLGGASSWGGIYIGSATGGSVSLSSSPSANLTLGSAGIDLNNGAATNRGISFASSVGIILGANQTWALGNGQSSSANITVAGTISGSGGLTATRAATGNNTLVLSGNNTFTGGFTLGANTVVNAGAAAVAAVGGDTTSSPYGAYSGTTALTINGGRFNQGAFAFHAKNININGDFTFSTTGRTEFGGAVNLGGGTRTMTLTRSANSTNTVILGGNVALRFSGATNAAASFGNGTIRIAADPAVTLFVPVIANANTVFTNNAGLTLGDKVLFAAGTTTLNSAATVPSVTLETGSWWNLAEAANIRNPQVNSLAGNGTVANLYNGSTANTLGTLTIRGNSGSTPTNFSGRIIDRDTAVFPNATNGITAVVKAGSTTQIFSGVNTYTGSTSVTGGTLELSGNGSINSSSGITVNGGTFKNNSSANLTIPLNFVAGTLGGTNLAGVSFTVGSGQKLSPGNSAGLLTTGAQTWNDGGSFDFEINDASGVKDTNWDRTLIQGTLTLGTISNLAPFTVNLISLNGAAPGAAANFNESITQSWVFATATSISGTAFASDKFTVNTSAFSNAFTGTFSVAQVGNELLLTYTAVPEPSAFAALAGCAVLGVATHRRRRASVSASRQAPSNRA
jgi:autotransporter-associated beta strand protein